MFILLVMFSGSIYLIKYFEEDIDSKKKNLKKYAKFFLPTLSLFSFFLSCLVISKILLVGNSKYAGIYFIILVGIILTIFNNTILQESKIKEYIKGKKFTIVGLFMALGVSAIVFGFLDNFGLKLGIEALDNSFLNLFLGPFSVDIRFKNEKKNIAENLNTINNWANGKWKSVINQVLRFKNEIKTLERKNPKIKDLTEDIEEFIKDDGGIPLSIPNSIKKKGNVKSYVRNIKDKYEMIENSKSMLGNTFSDFIGAVLGAALINLFTYMTSYDGISTGDENIDDSFIVRNLNRFLPFIEACFISLGCLVPVFLNIAMTRDSNNNNNFKAWLIVGSVAIIILVMMYLSVMGLRKFTKREKKVSLRKNLENMIDRLDIKEEDQDLYENVYMFINQLKQ